MKKNTIIKEAKSIIRLMNNFENHEIKEDRKEDILYYLDFVLFKLMEEYADKELKKGNNPVYLQCTTDFRKWIETGEE